jgi:V/A-type H+-transporting ATPase subunit C
VTRRWESLGARARGLAGHLLTDERMRRLERAKEVGQLIQEIRDTPYALLLGGQLGGAEDLDEALARSASERLHTLARWAGDDGELLLPIFLEQDAHNVRAVLRGLAGATSHERRLSSTMPTPTLGRAALERLASAESPASLASMLVAWGHPLGSGLGKEAQGARFDIFRMEVALTRGFTAAASAAAASCGETMRRFVGDSLDMRNILTALLLVGARREEEPAAYFIDGGGSVSRRDFLLAASARDRAECAERLEKATRGTLFTAPLRERPSSVSSVAARVLAARIQDLTRRGRRDPVSPVPAILFVLRLRMEVQLLRRVIWRLSLAGGRRG